MRSPTLLCLSFLSICVFLTPCAGADESRRVFKAGAATSNITPPLGELIVGGWQPIPATNIHDELHARCLVLDDGKIVEEGKHSDLIKKKNGTYARLWKHQSGGFLQD